MICPNCDTENRPGRKFCMNCGAPLTAACAACGSENEPGARFCGECGAALVADAHGVAPPAPAKSERRVVSVLFADLVGFTTLSEQRDPEDVREFLGRYFEQARRLIERYGGVVEKFIGDAVMAVWGTPVAQEVDAELAVRAAFDLVAGVTALGEEFDIPGLAVRAGVATGEAAVSMSAEGQGMVAGDLVNTASRVQTVAEPGTVLVDERTRRLSEASIAYEDMGEHMLKGKAEPLRLWRASRVVAARGGAGRSAGLEPPFVGRDSDFRLVRELFHATVEERRARLVSVIGVAGIGKSRLGWEFFKYIDGLVELVWWHRGRCLAYGEGVSYWALAEMVRMRAEIAEEDPPESAQRKLHDAVERYVGDPDERGWIEDRLGQLLGLSERTGGDREDLFAAWRLFFERLAAEAPVALVFEDLQWADTSLLDFIEYVLEWSRAHPIFVLTFARPELSDRRPDWGAGRRNFHSLYLDPLSDADMEALLGGLVPGLSGDLIAAIKERAEGVPLYAVETVRMLLDRGLLVIEGATYRPAGAVEALAVPESLHALIAARLDGLEPDERRLLQHAAVLGKSFTKRALAAVTGRDEHELEPLLSSLVRKEVLGVQAELRSPERGQYAFLQALVQTVARDTLSRRERKEVHLRAARFLESDWGADEDEIVEVVAAHYLDAYDADPQAEDAAEIIRRGRELLVRAGERADSLGANAEAERHFARAAELSEATPDQAELLERAGQAALAGGRSDDAAGYFERARELAEQFGNARMAARVTARIAEVLWQRGEIERAIELMEDAFATISEHEHDRDLAVLAAQLGRFHAFMGHYELALPRLELALDVAESLRATEVLSEALNSKALTLVGRRPQESVALLEHAVKLALEHDHAAAAIRAYNNLAHMMLELSRFEDAARLHQEQLALARRRGNLQWETSSLGALGESLHYLGRWDEVSVLLAEIPDEAPLHGLSPIFGTALAATRIATARGDIDEARRRLAGVEPSGDIQERVVVWLGRAILARAEGRYSDALRLADEIYRLGMDARLYYYAAEAWVEAVECLLALGDTEAVRERLAQLDARPPVEVSPYLAAHRKRFRARTDSGDAAEQFEQAATEFREIGARYWFAVTLLERAESLAAQGNSDAAAPALDEATGIFEQLRARPILERAKVLRESETVPTAVAPTPLDQESGVRWP